MPLPRPSSAGCRDGKFSVQEEMDRLRQRLRQDRDISDTAQAEMIEHMQRAMEAARAKLNEERNAARRQSAFLERCRVEATSARQAFEADVRRRQAMYDASDRHKQRREAERQRAAEEQRRREATGYGDEKFGGTPSLGTVLFVSTQAQERAYEAYEHAFAAFEAAPCDEPAFTLASMPWPPSNCPVSGARRGEAAEMRKQRLKMALLRWHPDKFLAAHAGKFVEGERGMIVEAVSAVLRRVQAERAAAERAAAVEQSPTRCSPAAAATAASPCSSTTGNMSAGAQAAAQQATAERMAAAQAASAQAVREAAAAAGREAAAARSTHAATASGFGLGHERFIDKENLRQHSVAGSPSASAAARGDMRPPRTPPPGSGPRGPAYARASRPTAEYGGYASQNARIPAARGGGVARDAITRPSKRYQAADGAAMVAGPRTSKYIYESRYA
jgi:hypothetical protein